MKGVLLAGGSGSRLYPTTTAVSKQLIPVYDKPTIYYPLTTLMQAGIKDILVISTPRDIPSMQALLGDGHQFGIRIEYKIQEAPRGIAEAMILSKDFVGEDPSVLILGDNLFYGHDLGQKLKKSLEGAQTNQTATVFAHHVSDPERYGVVRMGLNQEAIELVEKPKTFISSWAVTGLYVYPRGVAGLAESLKPSARGELEITDLNNLYLNSKQLHVQMLGRGYAWLDTGTPQSLLEASQFVATLENRQGRKIGCPEETAYLEGFISKLQLQARVEKLSNCDYRNYLKELLELEHGGL